MKRDARVVAEQQGRQEKVNFANTISRAVRAFVNCEVAMISVPVVRARIHLVKRLRKKFKKKVSLIRYQKRDKNKTFNKISSRQTKDIWKTKQKSPLLQAGCKTNCILRVIEALFLYLLVTSQEITPNKIFADYHKIIEFCSEVTSYQNVFRLRPRSSSAIITEKLQEIKDKLKVDEELFKKQIQYNWFSD